MDKLSDYIPFLIILVSLVFTVIGKKKKQDEVTEKTTLPGKTSGEYGRERKSIPTLTTSYQKVSEEKPKKQPIRQPEIKQEKSIAFISPAPAVPESEKEGYSSFSFENEDDVMKAIIYAEIINRKEY